MPPAVLATALALPCALAAQLARLGFGVARRCAERPHGTPVYLDFAQLHYRLTSRVANPQPDRLPAAHAALAARGAPHVSLIFAGHYPSERGDGHGYALPNGSAPDATTSYLQLALGQATDEPAFKLFANQFDLFLDLFPAPCNNWVGGARRPHRSLRAPTPTASPRRPPTAGRYRGRGAAALLVHEAL